jgi:hypothetical protein
MMIAAAFGERICRDLSGFWFQNRAVPGGAAVGFPDVTMMLSPFEVTMSALSRAKLNMLEDVARDLGGTLARARAAQPGDAAAGAPTFGPEDYRRMFDPGFVQFACVDLGKVRALLARTPVDIARDVEQALTRMPDEVPRNVRASIRDQIAGSLRALPADQPLSEQATAAPPLVELVALLEGAIESTRFAPAELWQHVLLPLLHVGPAETFPALDDEDKAALREGADPLLLYVETLPYRSPAADEDGLLGIFPPGELRVIHPALAQSASPRLIVAPVAPLASLFAEFNRGAVRAAVGRFTRHAVAEAQGADAAAPNVDSGLLGPALELLGELATVVEAVSATSSGERVLCVRRAPEAEAASDAALVELRRAMQGPRIILV